jgi:septum site-determining protein MinC
MLNTPVELKGSNFTLSVAYLHSPDPEIIYTALQEKVQKAPAFLLNAPVVLNVSALPADCNIVAIQDAVTRAGLLVIGITGCQNEQNKQAVTEAKLALLTEGKGKKQDIVPPPPSMTPSMIVNSPVRTGQQIYARGCDLIVTSNVSAGAEIIADGNIHVYGHLRGRALAGAGNNDKAQIFCTQIAAELVSIAGQYWLSDQIPAEYYEKAAQLSLKNGLLTINYLK